MPNYSNYFPTSYPYMYQPVQQPVQNAPQQPQSNGGIIWIQGESAAKSYLVAPNTTVQLWDSECQRIYLKSADASGMPSIKTLEYQIVDDKVNNQPIMGNTVNQNIDMSQYVTRKELEEVLAKINTGVSNESSLSAVPAGPAV